MPGYHGELAIDPANGAILRVQVQTELPGFVPTDRSDIMVIYGRVKLGGKTDIVPIRSVAVHRGRTMLVRKLDDWNTSFQTWGSYETQILEFTFSRYHVFEGEGHILPGFTPIPDDDSPNRPSSQKPN